VPFAGFPISDARFQRSPFRVDDSGSGAVNVGKIDHLHELGWKRAGNSPVKLGETLARRKIRRTSSKAHTYASSVAR
jgi:hypothetical protein